MKIMKANAVVAITKEMPQMIEKPRIEWLSEDNKKEIMWVMISYTKYLTKIFSARLNVLN